MQTSQSFFDPKVFSWPYNKKPFEYWIQYFWQIYDASSFWRSNSPVFCLRGIMPEIETTCECGHLRGKHSFEYKVINEACMECSCKEYKIGQKEKQYIISKDKPILLTPMSFLQWCKKGSQDENYLKPITKQRMDAIGDIQVNIDSVSYKNQLVRASTDIFTLDKRKGLVAATDGYWLYLKPGFFKEGIHLIDTYGTCSSGATRIPLQWELTIT